MNRFRPAFRLRPLAVLLAFAGVATAVACTDNLESDAGCPLLCPGQDVALRDTVLDAVMVDSSVAGFPAIGTESYLLIGTRGDTTDTRGIFRFDSLPTTFRRSGVLVDSAIQAVDSAYLLLRVDTLITKPGAPVTVSVYDVETGSTDSSATDTTVAVLGPLFRADRLLGSATFAPDSLTDTLRVPIVSDSLLAFITANKRLRLGVQVTGTNRAELLIGSSNSAQAAEITFKPVAAGDTTGVPPMTVLLRSYTPIGTTLASNLLDYLIVVKSPPAAAVPVVAVGGLPGRRLYLRFNLPPGIVDSSTVLRATLELHQVANPGAPDASDSVVVLPQALLASAAVTDLTRALSIIADPGDVGLGTQVRFAPADSGLREFEMVQLVRAWHQNLKPADPRALAIRTQLEGVSAALFWFSASDGPLALRPRIHVTYVPRGAGGGAP